AHQANAAFERLADTTRTLVDWRKLLLAISADIGLDRRQKAWVLPAAFGKGACGAHAGNLSATARLTRRDSPCNPAPQAKGACVLTHGLWERRRCIRADPRRASGGSVGSLRTSVPSCSTR